MYTISLLADHYWRGNERHLLQHRISAELACTSADEVADVFCEVITKRDQTHKYDCRSFVACHFEHTDTTEIKLLNGAFREVPVRGWLRKGDAADSHLTLLAFDIDNDNPDRPRLTETAIEALVTQMGWKAIGWHTYSSRPDHQKVRLVLFPTRPVTWTEHRTIWAAVDYLLFQQQSDGSIYDRGDHLFGPTPHGCWRINWGSGDVDVDDLLAIELPPAAFERVRQAEAKPRQKLTQADIDRLNGALTKPPHDRFHLENPLCFDPAWRDDYANRAVNGSHWATMRSLLARIVYRHKRFYGRSDQMGFHDLTSLAQAIDAGAGYYFLRKHGGKALAELVALAMQVAPMTVPSSTPKLRANRLFKKRY